MSLSKEKKKQDNFIERKRTFFSGQDSILTFIIFYLIFFFICAQAEKMVFFVRCDHKERAGR